MPNFLWYNKKGRLALGLFQMLSEEFPGQRDVNPDPFFQQNVHIVNPTLLSHFCWTHRTFKASPCFRHGEAPRLNGFPGVLRRPGLHALGLQGGAWHSGDSDPVHAPCLGI